MLDLNFSGTQVLLGTGMIILLLLILGLGGRRFFRHQRQGNQQSSRTKYNSVDVFRYQPVFLRLGLICALAFTFLAFNWTQFATPLLNNNVSVGEWEQEIDQAPPITNHPPPPPPPPPPPKFEAVVDPNIIDTLTFRSGDIGSNTPVAPKTITRPAPPKYVPPPPPIKDDSPELVVIAERMPVFGDCADLPEEASRRQCSDQAIIQFIGRHVRYPSIAKENDVSGTAVVRFVVELDGTLSNIEIVRDPGATLGVEAERVVQLMADTAPKWVPGKQQGRPVRVQFTLPVRFQLER